jgi:pimeloyl-ACP methyl ester carboxylesterase
VAIRDINGRRIEVVERGDGRPVLFLHGNPLDHHDLMVSLDHVFAARSGFRRLHVDLPGFGASPPDPTLVGSDGMLTAAIDLLDGLCADEPALIVGASWGAYLARGLVARRRGMVAGVALICPVIIATRTERDLDPHEPMIVDDDGRPDPGDELDAAFRSIAVIDGPAQRAYFREVLAPAVVVADEPTQERLDSAYAFDEDIDAVGPPFELPSLIIVGRQDSVVGYRDALRLVERYPRATIAVLDVAGHNLLAERPTVVATLVDDWLDRVVTGGADPVRDSRG